MATEWSPGAPATTCCPSIGITLSRYQPPAGHADPDGVRAGITDPKRAGPGDDCRGDDGVALGYPAARELLRHSPVLASSDGEVGAFDVVVMPQAWDRPDQ